MLLSMRGSASTGWILGCLPCRRCDLLLRDSTEAPRRAEKSPRWGLSREVYDLSIGAHERRARAAALQMTIDDSSELRIKEAAAIIVHDGGHVRTADRAEEAHHQRGNTPHRSELPAIGIEPGDTIDRPLGQLRIHVHS